MGRPTKAETEAAAVEETAVAPAEAPETEAAVEAAPAEETPATDTETVADTPDEGTGDTAAVVPPSGDQDSQGDEGPVPGEPSLDDAVRAARAAALAALTSGETGAAGEGIGDGDPVDVATNLPALTGRRFEAVGGDVECVVLVNRFGYRRAEDEAHMTARKGDVVVLSEEKAQRGESLGGCVRL